jgi:mannonate dehydratase
MWLRILSTTSNRAEDGGGDNQPVGGRGGWGLAGDPGKIWTADELIALREQVEAAGLELAAVENFDPAHWYDVLLDGPKKEQQLQNIKNIIANAGRAGIPVIGYNFSLAGVAGRTKGPFARGDALSVGMQGLDETPIPRGMVWNMVYDLKLQRERSSRLRRKRYGADSRRSSRRCYP